MPLFKGSGVALVTPFKNGKVDYGCLGELIRWHIRCGTDAIISCGTTGEASTLTDEEHISVVEYTVKTAEGKVPVIAGAGSNDTAHACYMAQELSRTGCDGLLLVTPYYNKCSQKGLVKHYEKIADSTELPCILYSVPGRTGVNIDPDTVSYLSRHPNICGIKEASGNIAQVCEIALYADDNFYLYSGNDDMIIPVMSLGGAGAISTAANIIPEDIHNMIYCYINGDIDTAGKKQLEMKHLVDALFSDVNPIPVKAALCFMGKISMEYRLPLCPPSNAVLYNIMCQMKSYGIPISET